MRQGLVSLVTILVTTFSISSIADLQSASSTVADIQGRSSRGFKLPADNITELLAGHDVYEWCAAGLTTPTCAAIEDASFRKTGRHYGSALLVCAHGLVHLYGNPLVTPTVPPPAGEGQMTPEFFQSLADQCVAYIVADGPAQQQACATNSNAGNVSLDMQPCDTDPLAMLVYPDQCSPTTTISAPLPITATATATTTTTVPAMIPAQIPATAPTTAIPNTTMPMTAVPLAPHI